MTNDNTRIEDSKNGAAIRQTMSLKLEALPKDRHRCQCMISVNRRAVPDGSARR
jgi:hypothetical protein